MKSALSGDTVFRELPAELIFSTSSHKGLTAVTTIVSALHRGREIDHMPYSKAFFQLCCVVISMIDPQTN